jgi:hypothetical protein
VVPEFAPSNEDVLRRFYSLGYFQGQEWDRVRTFVLGDKAVREAVEKYRDFHGLPTGDSIDDAVVNDLMMPRCGVPDFVRPQDAKVCKWPMLNVTTAHRLEGLNPLSSEVERAVWREALAAWNAVCGLVLSQIDDMNRANIYANVGSTSSGVLAYSYLPCGANNNTRLAQVYNKATNWSRNLLLNVAIHEIGHAIGLDHGPSNSVMAPTASGAVLRPQKWDIDQVVARYGKPKPRPEPPQPEPTGPKIVITTRLEPGTYTLTPSGSDWDINP